MRSIYRPAGDNGVSIIVTAMFAFVMTVVQSVIVVVMAMAMVITMNINHFLFDDCRLGTFGSYGCTRGSANGSPDDGSVAASDGRTDGCPGTTADGASDYSVAIDAAGESGRREGGQGEEDECLLACHVDPFMRRVNFRGYYAGKISARWIGT